MPNFVVKYANYRIDEILNDSTLAEDRRNKLIEKITNTVIDCEYDYATVNETMAILANIGKEE